MRHELRSFVERIIEQGIAEEDFDPRTDPAVVTSTLFEVLNTTTEWAGRSDHFSLPAVGEWYARLFVQGLAPAERFSPPANQVAEMRPTR